MRIIGIRNKSTSTDHTFFFSIESNDLNELRIARDKVVELLRCEFVSKWHD